MTTDNKLMCRSLVERAKRCIEDFDKRCVMAMIEEMIRNNCHDGRLVGGEVADGVREVVHELWLVSNYAEEGELLSLLRKYVSRSFLCNALHKRPREIQWYLERYGLG
jgi:hypothetical protein